MRRNVHALAMFLLIATAVTGCGGGAESSVTGTVTLDGAPLDRGSVSFVPIAAGAGASATINADGTFEARTGSSAGLQSGEYLVTVQARAEAVSTTEGAPPMPGKLLTPKKYDSTSTSGLKATISPGANELKLELTSDAA